MVAHLRVCLVMRRRRMRRIAGGDGAGVIKRDERKVLRDGC